MAHNGELLRIYADTYQGNEKQDRVNTSLADYQLGVIVTMKCGYTWHQMIRPRRVW
jgi:hypothetical protein